MTLENEAGAVQSAGGVQQSAPVQGSVDTASVQSASTPVSSAPSSVSQTAEQQALSVRDALANYGLDLRQHFNDDHAALQHLVSLARRLPEQEQLARYGQEYLRHADKFQSWLRSQQEAERSKQQQQPWFKAPEYDPSWLNKLVRDPVSGELRPAPGAPPDLVQKYIAWHEHRNSFLDNLAKDPIGAIKPGLEEMVKQITSEMIRQNMGQYQEQSRANSFVQQNASWLYETNAEGVPVRDQSGRPRLSELGQRFGAYVQRAQSMGLVDTASQQEYATAMLERDWFRQQQSRQQQASSSAPVDPAQAVKQQFIADRQANGSGNLQAPPGNTNGQVKPAGLNQRGLQEMMLQEMKAAGY